MVCSIKMIVLQVSSLVFVLSIVQGYKVVCYHTNWSVYRSYPAKFDIADIDAHLCTHLIYSFGAFDANGFLKSTGGNVDYQKYTQFNNLKTINPSLKTLLAIGGWTFGSVAFSNMAADKTKRTNFVDSSVELLRQYGFDGLDLDWEYPAQRGGRIADKANFAQLCEELSIAFDAEALETRRARLLLTAAVPTSRNYIKQGYDVPKLNKYLDFVNVMTYDFHGGWDKVTGHNSPLYPSSLDVGYDRYANVNETANYWHQEGLAKDKVIVGIPTYGRTFTLSNSYATGLKVPATTGPAGPYTGEGGFYAYYEVCTEVDKNAEKTGTVVFDTSMKASYYYNNNLWIAYDSIESVEAKAKMITDYQYGGMMVWALDLDDFNKICSSSTRKYPLITAASDVLRGNNRPGQQPNPPTTVPTINPPTTVPTIKPHVTTTTKPANGVFSCANLFNGSYKDPADCSKFYKCVNHKKHQFTCASGLLFDDKTKNCNWPDEVTC